MLVSKLPLVLADSESFRLAFASRRKTSAFVLSAISSMWFKMSALAASWPFGKMISRSMSIVAHCYDMSAWGPPAWNGQYPRTRVIGVSFNNFCRILCTISESPETQTFVTRAVSGPRCIPGTGLGFDEVTVACSLSPLPSLTCLHRLLKFSTLRVCTGRACTGVSSAAPSGCVHFWKAPKLL